MDPNPTSNIVDEVFNNEYFKINKRLLVVCGLWPHSSKFGNLVKRICLAIILSIVSFPHANAMRIWCGKDLGLCAENIAGTIYTTGVLVKYSVTIFKENKISRVYYLLATIWSSITDPEEKEIMLENAKIGKIKTYGYLGYLAIAGIVFTQTGMIPTVLDFILPLNESRPKIKMVHAEYIIDQDKYFFEIYYFYCLVGVVSTAILMCIDTMYTVVVHQNLAIFCIIKHRLYLATENPYKGSSKEDDYAYNTIISAIRLHQESIELSKNFYIRFFLRAYVYGFNDLMENSFDILFLWLIIICVLFLSFGAITIMENSDNIIDLIRMSMFEFGVCIHLLYMSWPGQLVISESSDLFIQVYTNKWYHISPRAKVLLQIMMLRCMKPSCMTAAGLYVMNFENYAAIIKSTMSYITVLASFRE